MRRPSWAENASRPADFGATRTATAASGAMNNNEYYSFRASGYSCVPADANCRPRVRNGKLPACRMPSKTHRFAALRPLPMLQADVAEFVRIRCTNCGLGQNSHEFCCCALTGFSGSLNNRLGRRLGALSPAWNGLCLLNARIANSTIPNCCLISRFGNWKKAASFASELALPRRAQGD